MPEQRKMPPTGKASRKFESNKFQRFLTGISFQCLAVKKLLSFKQTFVAFANILRLCKYLIPVNSVS